MFKVGDKVRRVRHSGTVSNCPIGHEAEVLRHTTAFPGGFWYKGSDGEEQNSPSPEDWELVPTGPVRTETVTKRRIVPGVYGRLRVGDGFAYGTEPTVALRFVDRNGDDHTGTGAGMTATELDDLALVASQLAEALRDA